MNVYILNFFLNDSFSDGSSPKIYVLNIIDKALEMVVIINLANEGLNVIDTIVGSRIEILVTRIILNMVLCMYILMEKPVSSFRIFNLTKSKIIYINK